jgi:hypothetical protein
VSKIDAVYLFLLTLALPMDWFAPTGLAFREFGAKPAVILMVLASLLIILKSPSGALQLTPSQTRIFRPLALTLLTGSIAFFVNILMRESLFGRVKNPVVQFVGQSGLYAAFLLVIVAHGFYLRTPARREFIIKSMVPVALIYLAALLADATGFLTHANGLLALFHTETVLVDARPSGLFSEPSYFGAFAGLYGTPLVLGYGAGPRIVRVVLGAVLFAASLAIHAKTFLPVIILQLLALLFCQSRRRSRAFYTTAILGPIFATVFMIISNSALDFQANLSSATRFGSTITCLRASFAGYGVAGIGFGQFHFFYRPEFAPSYLLSSSEALATMAPSASSRASAFNLYARLLLETGVIGLGAFLLAIFRTLNHKGRKWTPHAEFGMLISAGSLGFFMTQDPLFLPSLALGIALILGERRIPSPVVISVI